MEREIDKKFIQILKEELIHAQGCTEPIALSLAGAKCRQVLGAFPKSIEIKASGNIVKNVQGVIIPGTCSLRGVESAVTLGVVGGDSTKGLEVLQHIEEEDVCKTKKLVENGFCKVSILETDAKLHFQVTLNGEDGCASIEIMHTHTNITKITKNGEELMFNPCSEESFNSSLTDRKFLSLENIYNFATTVDISLIEDILQEQIDCNLKIAEEGLKGDYGLSVGSTLLKCNGDSIKEKLKAYGAAGSDARMSGCDLPVVINSGSGNQGLTITSPVVVYAREKGYDHEKLIRGLIISNLIPIHIKTKIGRLSAFCGAVTAGIGVGCSLAFMDGECSGTLGKIIKNAIANLTGMICDGAKPSCAIKIASSIDSAFMSYQLVANGKVVEPGTGIISSCVEKTITNVTDIASKGMNTTDEIILGIMTHE